MARERETERGKGGIREEMRPKDIGIILVKVGINERHVHHTLINLIMKCFRDEVVIFESSSHWHSKSLALPRGCLKSSNSTAKPEGNGFISMDNILISFMIVALLLQQWKGKSLAHVQVQCTHGHRYICCNSYICCVDSCRWEDFYYS